MNEKLQNPLTREQRADIVTARETIRQALAGDTDVDLAAAATMLDHVLQTACPHDPESRMRSRDSEGRDLVTCWACGVSWYS